MENQNQQAVQQQPIEQPQITELQIIQAKQAAEFALTPAGQMVKEFEVAQRKGQMFAASTIVPEIYRNNVGNCVIALEMANRMGAVPLMVMQNLYIVHGNPAFSSKFLIASINASKRFSPLRFEFKGEEGNPDYGCRCYAYEAQDREHKEPLYGDWITMLMADKEGWTKKTGSKWLSMPSQMLRYRAAAFWQRVYCPEISMGLSTVEELNDVQEVEYVEVPAKEPQTADEKKAALRERKKSASAAEQQEAPQATEAPDKAPAGNGKKNVVPTLL